jgi:hypothetical protein
MLFVDLAFAVVSIGGLLVLDLKYPGEAAGALAALAPLMSIVPMWLYGLAVWYLRKRWIQEGAKPVTRARVFELKNSPGLLAIEEESTEMMPAPCVV